MRTRTYSFLAALGSVAALCAAPASGHAAAWVAGPAFAVGADASAGDIAESPDNSSTAAWIEGAGPADYAVHAQHGSAGDVLSAPFTLGPAAEAPYGTPRVLAAANGTTAIAWLGYDAVAGDYPLHVAFLDAAGALVRDALVVRLPTADAFNADGPGPRSTPPAT